MKAAVLESYGKIEIKDLPLPEMREDEVMVRVRYASICGSDQHIYKGEFHPRTRLPLIPGHEFAGEIERVGKQVQNFKKGEKVTVDPIIACGNCPACLRNHFPACTSLKLIGIDLDGGFAGFVSVRPEMLYRLPNNVSDEHAALVELLSIGFHASRRAGIKEGDSIAIWGAGKVGQAILHASRTLSSGPVFLVDILEERLNIAKKAFPSCISVNSLNDDPLEVIRSCTGGKGVDVAFEAVGHFTEVKDRFNPVRSCIQAIRGGGKVCTLGLGDEPVGLVMKELIWKEAHIIASRVSHGEFADAIQALSKGILNPSAMITGVMDLGEADKAFDLLAKAPQNHLKILLKL